MASIRRRTLTWTHESGTTRTAVRYQADYYDRTGKRHRRMFDLKKDAQRWLDEQTAGLVTGQWADHRPAGSRCGRTESGGWHARSWHPAPKRRTRSSCATTSSRPWARCG